MPAEPARGRSIRGRTETSDNVLGTHVGLGCTGLGTVSIGICIAQRKKCATMARKRAPQQKSIRGDLWESMGIYGKPGKNLTMLWESVTAYH